MKPARLGAASAAPSPVIALDLMRAAAALLVFLGHLRGMSFTEFGALPHEQQGRLAQALFALGRLGTEAVLVFFVLSGFLVGGQVVRHVREGRFDLSSYAVERCTRIFLPLIPAVVLTAALNATVLQVEPDLARTLGNMVGLNGVLVDTLSTNAPLWSLSYEIWFYLVAGATGYLLTRTAPSPAAYLLLAACVGVFSVLKAYYLLFWLFGAMSVRLLASPSRVALAALGLVLFVTGATTEQLASASKSFTSVSLLPGALPQALICIGIALAIPLLCDRKLNQRLSGLQGLAAYVSSRSYTLYLTHFPLGLAVSKAMFPKRSDLSWSSILQFLALVALVWICVELL